MISSVSGSNATALLSLFGRSQADTTTNPAQSVQPVAATSPPALSQGTGFPAQALFDALVHAGQDSEGGKDKAPLDDLLSKIFASLDTDGDGKLNPSELKLAFDSLTGTASDESNQTQATRTQPVQSLYESVFNALASDGGNRDGTAHQDDLSQKFLSMLKG